jgi:hypothetical protein
MTLAVSRSTKVSPASYSATAILAMLAVAYLNGYFKSISDWIHGLADSGFGLPVSLLDVLVIAVAVSLLRLERPDTATLAIGWAEAIAAATILVPSSAMSWAAAAGYASWCAWHLKAPARAGCALLAGLALAQLWSTVIIKWLALQLGSMDAAIAGAFLSSVFPGVMRAANVLGFEHGHSIIVLYGCTAGYFLPKLLLVQAATSLSLARGKPVRLLRSLALVASFGLIANGIRLALMATSPGQYHAIHSPLGGSVFDFLMIMTVFALTRRSRRS